MLTWTWITEMWHILAGSFFYHWWHPAWLTSLQIPFFTTLHGNSPSFLFQLVKANAMMFGL